MALADVLLCKGTLSEKRVVQVLTDIVAGLCGLHEHYLLHRDVKNIPQEAVEEVGWS
jgi:hypothetical protein